MPAGEQPKDIAAGDLNHDGLTDLAVTHRWDTLEGNLTVLYANSEGGLSTPRVYNPGYVPFAVQIADVNNDEILDAVTANHLGNNVTVLLGRGDGGLQRPVTVPA